MGGEECGRSTAPGTYSGTSKLPELLGKISVAGRHQGARLQLKFRQRQVLTFAEPNPYITSQFGPPPPRRDGVSSKFLTDMRGFGSGFDRKPQASTAFGFCGSPSGGEWGRRVPALFDR